MIDLTHERTISLSAAAQLLPAGRRGRPVNQATIFRWITLGVLGPNSQRIWLDGVRIGGRWITSVEALGRFAIAQTPERGPSPAPTTSSAARRRAADRATKDLRKIGV